MVSDISNEADLENLITDAAYAAKLQRDKGIIKLNNYVIHVSVKFSYYFIHVFMITNLLFYTVLLSHNINVHT